MLFVCVIHSFDGNKSEWLRDNCDEAGLMNGVVVKQSDSTPSASFKYISDGSFDGKSVSVVKSTSV